MVKKRGKTYYAVYHDPAMGKRVRRSLKCADKSAAEILEGELVRRAARTHAGLVDPYEAHAKRPLTEHVADWRATLLAKGNTRQHADDSASRVRRLIDGCRFAHWPDISASRVQEWIGEQRKSNADAHGLSAQTANYYLQAFKGFSRWAVKDRRVAESPVAHLDGFNTATDRRHDRRAFETDELRQLLRTTATGPVRYGMKPADRAMLYKLAASTGLRAGELRSLTPRSFDLHAGTVIVGAGYSKHRREDVQPIPTRFVAELRAYLTGRDPSQPVFGLPHPCSIVRMLRADLTAAREVWIEAATTAQERTERARDTFLAYRDGAGRVLDFHAFRHTYITNLTCAGVHPKDAQVLARHSTITLTMDRYTRTARGKVAKALDALPDLSSEPEIAQPLRATGTTEHRPTAPVSYLCQKGIRKGGKVSAGVRMNATMCHLDETLENKGKTAFSVTPMALGRGGVEPPTHGFSVRCSTN